MIEQLAESPVDFLYQQVTERFEQLITTGVLKTGDKLPSLRALTQEQGISLSTAFRAYCELEAKGFIEARIKSGYYVRYAPRSGAPTQPTPKPWTDPALVSVDDMIMQVYQNLSEKDIVQLSVAAPALELLPEGKLNKAMAEAVRTHAASCLNYEVIQGNQRLRTQIARYAVASGITVTEEDVVTTHGCMDALVLCLRAVTSPGDTVAIDSPTYFGIFSALQSLGLKALEIPHHPTTGLDLDYLENALQTVRLAACLFVPTFSNPTGTCLPDADKKRLVELLAEHRVPLIEDDIYGELYFGRQRPRTCKSFDQRGLVLLCSSVSKSLAPGYRVGWCLPGQYLAKVVQLKRMTTVSSTAPTQAAIGLFFENGRYDLHLRHLRKALHTQCLRYTQAIAEYFPPEIKVTQPQGGYALWVQMPPTINAYTLFRAALREKIGLAPGQIFSMDGRFKHHFRLCFGAPYTQSIDASLRTLGQLIREPMEPPTAE